MVTFPFKVVYILCLYKTYGVHICVYAGIYLYMHVYVFIRKLIQINPIVSVKYRDKILRR